MANFLRGRYKNPLAFFVKPAGPGARHAARVKVNANYNMSFDTSANFSISFFPTTGVAANHNVGSASQTDVDGMVRWLEANRDTFIDFYTGAIGAVDFDAKLSANLYP